MDAISETRRRLEEAADGLVYTSEIDSPFRWVRFPPASADAAGVASVTGAARGEIEERTLEHFFAGHIEEADPEDPIAQQNVGRYRRLRETLGTELAGLRAYRIGHVKIRGVLLGRLADGSLGGLETEILET